MKKLFRNFAFRAFWGRRDEGGGVTAYSAFFIVFAVGVGALALDVGRMTVLHSQMQDRADAGAMAAAVQLDGREGAQTRATAVAMHAMSQTSGIPGDGEDSTSRQSISTARSTRARLSRPATRTASSSR